MNKKNIELDLENRGNRVKAQYVHFLLNSGHTLIKIYNKTQIMDLTYFVVDEIKGKDGAKSTCDKTQQKFNVIMCNVFSRLLYITSVFSSCRLELKLKGQRKSIKKERTAWTGPANCDRSSQHLNYQLIPTGKRGKYNPETFRYVYSGKGVH